MPFRGIIKLSRTDARKSKRKKKRKVSFELNKKDVEYINRNTRFDEEEIQEWYRGFQQDCPDGQLHKAKVKEMYSMIVTEGNAAVLVDQIFRLFDKDGNGTIDFKEFMLATDMTSRGSNEERLRWAFKMYDEDGSGLIDLKEMLDMVGTLYEMQGTPKEEATKRVHQIFGHLDLDGSGHISEEEFIKRSMEDEYLGGKKQKEENRRISLGISRQDVEFLIRNTRWEEEEIQEWFSGFKMDCPSGRLKKAKVKEMYAMILPEGNASVFVDQIFRIFDKDGNGSIDFKEFMIATDMTTSGSTEEQLRWTFKMFDKDGSGKIELKEMAEIVVTLYELQGFSLDTASERANRTFGNLDLDGNGEITEEEFIRGCLQDQCLVATMENGREWREEEVR